MARLLHVSLRAALVLGVGACCFLSATSAPTATNSDAPKNPKAQERAANKAAAKQAAAQDDAYVRYGKILAPSEAAAHPFKLNMPFPGVGEVRVPSPDELKMREKLEQLATLSDDEIRTQLQQWPPFAKMSLADEGAMLMRIQQFKEQRSRIASGKARKLGLSTLTPDQAAKFEKEYWEKRFALDRDLAKQFDPVVKAREQKFEEELFREFSTTPGNPPKPVPPSAAIAQNTKPDAPAPPPAKPSAAPSKPSAPPVGAGIKN